MVNAAGSGNDFMSKVGGWHNSKVADATAKAELEKKAAAEANKPVESVDKFEFELGQLNHHFERISSQADSKNNSLKGQSGDVQLSSPLGGIKTPDGLLTTSDSLRKTDLGFALSVSRSLLPGAAGTALDKGIGGFINSGLSALGGMIKGEVGKKESSRTDYQIDQSSGLITVMRTESEGLSTHKESFVLDTKRGVAITDPQAQTKTFSETVQGAVNNFDLKKSTDGLKESVSSFIPKGFFSGAKPENPSENQPTA